MFIESVDRLLLSIEFSNRKALVKSSVYLPIIREDFFIIIIKNTTNTQRLTNMHYTQGIFSWQFTSVRSDEFYMYMFPPLIPLNLDKVHVSILPTDRANRKTGGKANM